MVAKTHSRYRFTLQLVCWIAVSSVHAAAPNLLIIMTDEHNFRTLGCYRELMSKDQAHMWGEAVVETPHIDSIAKEGVICTSFYATSPVCSPSRAAFVSGQYPQNTPVSTNNISLDDSVITFAELLKREGYDTGYIGKWHLDGGGKPQWAPKRTFGFEDNRFMFNRGHWKHLVMEAGIPKVGARDGKGNPSYSVAGTNAETFATDFLCKRTIEFIQQKRDKPFCMMLSLPDPHGPDTVRPPYDTMYTHQTYTKPASAGKPEKDLPTWAKKESTKYEQSQYYGMVKCIDDNIGAILNALKKKNLLDNTIVVFTSDHGDLRGEHSKQNKGVPYEASSRVPFLVRYPAKVKAGTVVNEALTSVDFLPTILSLLEVETAKKEEGRDAAALLSTGKAPKGWSDIAFMRGTGGANTWLSALSDRYKLVLSVGNSPWLFDLDKDPNELTNYFPNPEYAAVAKRMATDLQEYATTYKDPHTQNPSIAADLTRLTGKAVPTLAKPTPAPKKKKKGKKKK